jgi:hypothetical protein
MRSLLAFTALTLPCIAAAWEPFKTDVTQQAFPAESAAIDHLVPIQMGPNPRVSGMPYTYLARYSSRPSFWPGVDVYVVRDQSTSTYRIHYLEGAEASKKEPKSRVVDIPQALAALIYDVWANALLDVRYDRAPGVGLDGTTHFFSTWIRGLGTLDGETWMPEGDRPPAWMVGAGEFLAQIARDDRPDVNACHDYFKNLKARLFRYYESRSKMRPNKSPEPTPTAVTPRATEGKSK